MNELLKDLKRKQVNIKAKLEFALCNLKVDVQLAINKNKEGDLLNRLGIFQNITQIENINAEYHQVCELIQMTEWHMNKQTEVKK